MYKLKDVDLCILCVLPFGVINKNNNNNI